MPFVISVQTLSEAWESAQALARQMKQNAQTRRAETLNPTTPSSSILYFERELRAYRDRLDAIAALPGIAAYVASLPNTPAGYDVVAEYNAMRAQIVNVVNWIRANFPKEAGGYLLERTWGADGPIERTFTPADLAGYRAQLDTLITAIG